MSDLLVVGLELIAQRPVHIDDATVPEWRKRGHNGDQTLVCYHCYYGIDVPPRTIVARVPRGRVGGQVRHHFAHPPGQAPPGGHNPESVWHLETKVALARWAVSQPGVVDAMIEAHTADGRRRADVLVTFTDHSKLAMEIQSDRLTDAEWLSRQRDYQTAGIAAVWIWHSSCGTPGIVLANGAPVFFMGGESDSLSVPVGCPHLPKRNSSQDLERVVKVHDPPCVGDSTVRVRVKLSEFGLDSSGMHPPSDLVQRIPLERRLAMEQELPKLRQALGKADVYERAIRDPLTTTVERQLAARQAAEAARNSRRQLGPVSGGFRRTANTSEWMPSRPQTSSQARDHPCVDDGPSVWCAGSGSRLSWSPSGATPCVETRELPHRPTLGPTGPPRSGSPPDCGR